ncbi:hypothetical protein [Siminovitchia acidinfaciens]|uniref:hypothetical protein n=1 Tax=Siminovitchia acidinfaciens TaxID=2321395 RepID=UPI0013DEFE8C|nr:hypothetical protein [Siminovitchia acidinfaciens]
MLKDKKNPLSDAPTDAEQPNEATQQPFPTHPDKDSAGAGGMAAVNEEEEA